METQKKAKVREVKAVTALDMVNATAGSSVTLEILVVAMKQASMFGAEAELIAWIRNSKF